LSEHCLGKICAPQLNADIFQIQQPLLNLHKLVIKQSTQWTTSSQIAQRHDSFGKWRCHCQVTLAQPCGSRLPEAGAVSSNTTMFTQQLCTGQAFAVRRIARTVRDLSILIQTLAVRVMNSDRHQFECVMQQPEPLSRRFQYKHLQYVLSVKK